MQGQGTEIERYFDRASIDHDFRLRDPILKYEQDMRHKAVLELIRPRGGELILDVGCGNGRDLRAFAENGATCVGIDLSRGMLNGARKSLCQMGAGRVHLLRANANYLPFKAKIVDKVSCSEVIEHIPDWNAAISEMNRVLKMGGELVITTPNRHSLYGITKKISDFVKSSIGKAHPYDEWKTQNEVIAILRKHDILVDKKIGICFTPGELTWPFPKRGKEFVVKISSHIEKCLRNKLTGKGYMIGLHAKKHVIDYSVKVSEIN